MDATEAIRRKSNVVKLREFFLLHPMQWINAIDLEPIAGRHAWRTRTSELRLQLQAEGAGTIENRQQRANTEPRAGQGSAWLSGTVLSQYRYLPFKKIGRDSTVPVSGLPLFDNDGPWQR